MRLAGLLLIIFVAQPVSAQHSLSFPLNDSSLPVWHGWLYDDGSPHNGIDYKEPLGTPVLAADDGIAMSAVQPLNPSMPGKDVYGRFVLIQHANGLSTLYAHLSASADTIFSTPNRYDRNFALWTPVKKGDVIGFVGASGVVTTQVVHLHFEAAINPQGDYTGHVLNKADPYAIKNVALYYPPSGPRFTICGLNFLWLTCPIAPSAPIMNDDFGTNVLNANRWSLLVPPPTSTVTVNVTNQQLQVAMGPGAGGGGVLSNCSLSGDFDAQVDYILLNWSANNTHSVRLGARDLGPGLGMNMSSFFSELYVFFAGTSALVPTSDTAGKLRLVRTGSTISGFFLNGTSWVLVGSAAVSTGPTRFNLDLGTGNPSAPSVSIAFDNFKVNAGTISCPGGP